MWIALPDAVKLYARFCQARYGTSAAKVVREKAQELRLKGDLQGYKVWSDVEHEIGHTDPSAPPGFRPQEEELALSSDNQSESSARVCRAEIKAGRHQIPVDRDRHGMP